MSRRPSIPKYRLHKSTGRAVVTIRGRDIYLGQYNSPESLERYKRTIAEFLSNPVPRPMSAVRTGHTVAELVAAYLVHAREWYVKDGRPTSQVKRVEQALQKATDLYGTLPAIDFGPRALKAVRDAMVRDGWTRGYVNSCVGCVRRAFKWAVGEEILPGSVYEALRAVEGLRAGRCAARETSRVLPVPEAHIEPALACAPPVIADMARIQLLTGMRPGEVCQLRPCDIANRGSPVWVFEPASHKTEHHGARRQVHVGPRAQAVLAPYLLREEATYCFSPREAMERLRRERGQRATFGRNRQPGERYTTMSYGHAIRLACGRAGVRPWHPHQLRHNAATLVRSQFGPEAARAVLGQRSLKALEIYAELDAEAARAAMGKVG